jgi:hypothetical protein
VPGVEARQIAEREISLSISDADLEFDQLRSSKQKTFKPEDIKFAS